MWRRVIGFSLAVSVGHSVCARAEEISTATYNVREASQTAPFGFGVMSGELPGETGYSFIVQAERHFDQRENRFGFRQYGEHESRFEAGQGVGIAMQATTGITLVGLDPGEHVFPHVGFEAFSGQFAVSSDTAREKYYEWLPTMSAGMQFDARGCRFLPLARGGAGVGNLGKPGALPALGSVLGVGAYLDCKAFDLSAEAAHLSAASSATDLARADFSVPLSHGDAGLGLRGERISEPDRLEQRVLLVFKSRMIDLLF